MPKQRAEEKRKENKSGDEEKEAADERNGKASRFGGCHV
jgi:hypothetical protein